MLCYYFEKPLYIFFAQDLPALLYYSHIPVTFIAVLVGLFVLINAPRQQLNRLLAIICFCFASWAMINLYLWTNIDSSKLMFAWSLLGIIQGFIAIFSVYFIYVFLYKKDVSVKIKLIFFTLLSPILLFTATDINLRGFNISNCDAFGYEGIEFYTYYSLLGLLAIVWIFVLLTKNYRGSKKKKEILLMGIGIEFFLFFFFTVVFLVSYLITLGLFSDSQMEFYGLFGMAVFMTFIGVLIVQFRTFNVGMLASQALVIALVILTSSQFTYVASRTGTVITAVTLVFTGLIGIILVRNVKKEVKLREELQALTQELAVANDKLKDLDKLKSEFVSIASHQLRSPLTAIRGYASLLTDGSYGKLPEKANEALERISQSAKNMAYSIEDYLNVSRIESGNMKYNYSDFNLKDEVENVTDDLRSQAIKAGLMLIFRSDLKSKGIIHADQGKVIQIVQNLINNSIKYTEKGSIKVLVRDDVVRKRIFVDIIDTGIGMSEKTKASIFGKFERAENANNVNNRGTGLGLYVALMMAKAMEGNITAQSEGDGKGSIFTIELPLAM